MRIGRIAPWIRGVALAAVIVGALGIGYIKAFRHQQEEYRRTRSGGKLPADIKALLESATKFELLSLDPGLEPGAHDASAVLGERFYTFRILGTTEIADSAERAELLKALENSIWSVQHPGPPGELIFAGSMCFWPRHGIHAEGKTTSASLVICFECGAVEIHRAGIVKPEVLNINDSAAGVFNAALKKAGLPIAP